MKYVIACLLTLGLFGCNEPIARLSDRVKAFNDRVAELHKSTQELNIEIECLKEFVDNQWWVESRIYLSGIPPEENVRVFNEMQDLLREVCRKRLKHER
jgi:hypothetical protein